MNPFVRFLTSSIGRKYVMAVTGLSLTLFLLVHMAGNLTIYAGNEAFNEYADLIESNPLLPLAEAGLAGLFLDPCRVRRGADRAEQDLTRGELQGGARHGRKTVASTTMWITGPLLLVFLLIHIWDFRIAKELVEEYDLAQMVVDRLKSPIGFGIYVIAIVLVGLHMWHAFQSAFQTLGVAHLRYRALIKNTGRLITALLVAGFGGIPFYLFFLG